MGIYYLQSNSCFSSGVSTTCSGTNSCSVMLISSSDSRNCSKIYLGAMSTRDCFAEGVMPAWTTMIALVMFSCCIRWQYVLIVLMPILGSSGKNTNIWSVHKEKQVHQRDFKRMFVQIHDEACWCNTYRWDRHCGRPTGSNRFVQASVRWKETRLLRIGTKKRRKHLILFHLGLSPNCPLNASIVWSNSSWVTRYPRSWHNCEKNPN